MNGGGLDEKKVEGLRQEIDKLRLEIANVRFQLRYMQKKKTLSRIIIIIIIDSCSVCLSLIPE